MSFSVTLNPSGKQFTLEADQNILQAALAQNIVLPYGCKDGACGSCKSRVLSGQVVQGAHTLGALSEAEKALGLALLCCAKPASDLVIEARVLAAVGEIAIRKMPCRVASLESVATDVKLVRLQLPANEKLQYLAGQYIELILRDGVRRQYSLATAPFVDGHLELHIRHMAGGKFTDALFGVSAPAVKERDILRFEGPMGTFFLREDSARPIVLLASGTGFAPVKAILEQAFHKGLTRPATLYWGGRRPGDLYLDALCRQWAASQPLFSYVPVVSEALPEDGWTGRSGLVHQAVMADLPDLSGHQVYACGAPVMVSAAERDFVAQCGLPAGEFYSDAFTSAADVAGEIR